MKVPWKFLLPLLVFHITTITAVTVSNGTSSSYDPVELLSKIFQPNITQETESRQRGYGFIKFEGQADTDLDSNNEDPGQYGLIDPERDQRPLRFEDDYDQNYYANTENQYTQGNKPVKFQDSEDSLNSNKGVTFQDDNKVEGQGNKKKRKRRRRRKPKNGVLPYPGVGEPPGRPGFDGGRPGFDGGRPALDGYQGPYQPGYGLNQYGNPGYPNRPFRRPRRPRPRPSLATEALSSITGALTSIARYDDYQCVPRLLCEAAGGGALTGNGVLQSIAGIQPLLTLLSAYNGISTSPLFVFGRAVFLGMTSQGNTGTCRYAYPQCPTDPEQLIFYLNNHNGGFFRFFNSPQLPNQNVEQFYNQLGNQGYGIYQPQLNPAQNYQGYGYPNDPNSGQQYGLYQNNQGQYYGQNNEIQRPHEVPSLYNHQNYGSNYAYDYNNYGSGSQIRFKDSEAQIQKRIQNKPSQNLADIEENSFESDDVKTKWQFPEDQIPDVNSYNVRDSRTLKFPEQGPSYDSQNDSTRKGKQINYSNKKYHQNYYDNQQHVFSNSNRYQTSTYAYSNGQNNQNYYTSRPITIYSNNNYKPPPKYHNYNYNPSNNNAYQNQQSYYSNKQNIYSNNQKYQPTTIFNNEEYVFDHKHNFYVKKENSHSNNDIRYTTSSYSNSGNNYYNNNNKRYEEDGLKTVYVVRGNGDPTKPEIVKLRPGQSVY